MALLTADLASLLCSPASQAMAALLGGSRMAFDDVQGKRASNPCKGWLQTRFRGKCQSANNSEGCTAHECSRSSGSHTHSFLFISWTLTQILWMLFPPLSSENSRYPFFSLFLEFCYFCLLAARILLRSSPFPTGLGFLSAVFMLCSLPPDKEVTLPWTAHNSLPYNAAPSSISDAMRGQMIQGFVAAEEALPTSMFLAPSRRQAVPSWETRPYWYFAVDWCTGWHLAPQGFSFLPPS